MPRAVRCARAVTGFLGGATLVGLVLFVVDELGFRRDERRLAKTNGARAHTRTWTGRA